MKTTVLGRQIEFGVTEDSGLFKAEWDGERFEAPSLSGLKQKLQNKMKNKPINVPIIKFSEISKETVTKGTLVGIHSANHNAIVKWEGRDNTTQHNRWEAGLLRGDIDVKKLLSLHTKKQQAISALEDYVNKYQIDLHAIAKDQIS